jgi:hypothetical protein
MIVPVKCAAVGASDPVFGEERKEKYEMEVDRLSRHDFVDNQVRLQPFALAYNCGNFLRHPALPKSVRSSDWETAT